MNLQKIIKKPHLPALIELSEQSSFAITKFFKDRFHKFLFVLMCLALFGAILLSGIVENILRLFYDKRIFNA